MNFTEILHALPNDLPFVTDSDSEMLTREVTKNEVLQTLMSFPTSKSPRLDGLNVEFYHFFWTEFGEHLFPAVNFFFDNSVMPMLGVELTLL